MGEVRMLFFFFSSRRRHTRLQGDWSSDVCSSDLSSPTPSMPATSATCAVNATRRGDDERTSPSRRATTERKIGRASCRGRGENSGGAGSLKKKKKEVQNDE